MALQDLIHAIKEEGAVQADALKKEQTKAYAAKIRDIEQRSTALAQSLIAEADVIVRDKLTRAKRQAEARVHAAKLAKQQEELNRVYTDVAREVLALPQNTLVQWFVHLLHDLPSNDTSGSLHVSASLHDALVKACAHASCAIPVSKTPLNGTEGFRFVSDTVEIDCTLPTLLEETRQRTETKVANILFS